MLERSRVSCMAVTTYVPSGRMSTTVRHTPLCATDWSMCSSSAKEQRTVRFTLESFLSTATMVAASSTIPENMLVSEFWVRV